MPKKPKKEPIIYRGIQCDSDEEKYFLFWCFELISKGVIKSVTRSESIVLFEGASETVTVTKVLKTKTTAKQVEKKFLNPLVYTPDFDIEWSGEPLLRLIDKDYASGNISRIEVKPIFDKNGKTASFVIKQKWCYQQLGIFINLCIPDKLFAATFTPTEYLVTAKKQTARKINWKVRGVDEWLSTFKNL